MLIRNISSELLWKTIYTVQYVQYFCHTISNKSLTKSINDKDVNLKHIFNGNVRQNIHACYIVLDLKEGPLACLKIFWYFFENISF
jgi:hypothetical protein